MDVPRTSIPDLPEAKAFGEDEESVLLGYLDYHRAVLARKASGITDEQARMAACPPSEMTLLGVIRHMADVERHWFRWSLVGEDIDPQFSIRNEHDQSDDGDWHPPAEATLDDAFAAWRAEVEVADANIAAVGLDGFGTRRTEGQPPTKLRRIVVHMIEEYARHCGHADLIRQAIDGTVGD